MRKMVLLAVLTCAVACPAMAQDTPAVEVFGGYSYARIDGPTVFDSSLAFAGIFEEIAEVDTFNTNGFHVAVAQNLNDWFGGALEVSGHLGTPDVEDLVDADTSLYTVLFGPRFSFRKRKAIVPFAHVLVGVAHISATPKVDGIILPSSDETGFAAALGGGVDVALNNRVAIRVVQADYMPMRFRAFSIDLLALEDFGFNGPNKWQHNIRLSAGVVLRFGQK